MDETRADDRTRLPDGVVRIRRGDAAYPPLLAKLGNDAPRQLYVRGTLPDEPAIAMVGSRACTGYGRRIAHRLAVDVARCGFTVVSGLARGIDAAAHRGALDGGGMTVGVLPTGYDRVYPPGHTGLARRIARAGAVVTELGAGERVYPASFHRRNRIIAGLAVATVVIEAACRSGTKITVKFAVDYNREVLAVPGPIDSPTSEGANELIVEGAAPCTGIETLLEQLPAWARERARPRLDAARDEAARETAELSEAARAVLTAIPADDGCSVDRLAAATDLPIPALLAALTDLEARRLVRSVGGRYERS